MVTTAQLLNLGAAGLLVVLGATVLYSLRHRSGRAFAAFLFGLAGLYATSLPLPAGPERVLLAASRLLGAWGLLTFLVFFPRPIARAERRLLAAALICGGLADIEGQVLPFGSFIQAWSGEPDHLWFAIQRLTEFAFDTLGVGALFLLPMRARRLGAADPAAARSLALIAVGITLFVMGNARTITDAARGAAPLEHAFVFAAWSIAVTLLWALAVRGEHARLARSVALGTSAILGVGVLIGAVDSALVFPIGRVLGAGLLAYAILRGEIDGLDVKVRFALSKSTIAAAFVAAFFLASEGAQLVLGRENPYLGLIGAGALVFAMAPIQRAAERLAEKAVPSTAVACAVAIRGEAPDRERSYRQAVELALRDRLLSRDEERRLMQLAHHLGIPPARAAEIHDDIERERGVA